ncbi:phospholipid-transporting ATPase, putative [Entamoeba invadens IP1]|uniref:Phospholipid-transporting ATPase n=1 Tax=Entamoeba invadens IP1 TaxID=370355 RepID=A0A0A1U5Q1_ENTIV|nr:phospholipid-transporting ATPase, putative [Entamoeba invadens IP1]ELP89649.1 phospholipid-transporting ATPase, putative [Entamoeba invadens IP1]|eukprot:XP_004256420.1 phospholipid-transporting ATPase, putative [Entamoeba invadens IP1]
MYHFTILFKTQLILTKKRLFIGCNLVLIMFTFLKENTPFLDTFSLPKEKYKAIYINSINEKFPSNIVSTTKYNLFTFVPKFMRFYLSQMTNIYFLCNLIICSIPQISTVTPITALVPIAVVLLVTSFREIVEDFKRHKSDKMTNHMKYFYFEKGSETKIRAKDVKVGMTLKIENGQTFPADCVLIYSSHENGISSVETAALDGETSLKKLYVPKQLLSFQKEEIPTLNGELIAESPNEQFGQFSGNLCVNDYCSSTIPLNEKNLVLRGSVLRKTEYIYCIVCYTGKNTKQALNSSLPRNKQSAINKKLNSLVLAVVAFQLMLCGVMAGCATWKHDTICPVKGYWYLAVDIQLSLPLYFIKKFFGFFNVTSYMIPISLQVSIELTRYIQGSLIERDDYFKVKKIDNEGKETQKGMKTNCSVCIEEMGGVEYVLTDKTGTLTENEMKFTKCSINGMVFDAEDSGKLIDVETREYEQENVSDFFKCLSLCSSCSIEQKDSIIEYWSISPDEEALCEASSANGFTLLRRTQEEADITTPQGKTLKCQILLTNDFSSERKMMSVLVQTGTRFVLYAKGADSILSTLLLDNKQSNDLLLTTQNHSNSFANSGLRTLFIARRVLSGKEAYAYINNFEKLDVLSKNYKEEYNKIVNNLESNFELLGATAIEDKLQENVPETITTLIATGLKIWVITGDKQETAISIAKSCNLLVPNQKILCFDFLSENEFLDAAENELSLLHNNPNNEQSIFSVVLSGNNVDYFLNNSTSFKELALRAKTVVCCRVSPLQKASICKCVKKLTGKICLSIGDGMNDVPMITASDVGVGIYGKEGCQAAVSADFSIQKFSHLGKLLLFYGKNAKTQISTLIKFCFYKNAAFFLVNVFFAMISNYTAQMLYEDWITTCYNTFFTTLPPMAIALFDYDLTWDYIKRYPQSHRETLRSKVFSFWSYLKWFLLGIFQALVFFIVVFFIINKTDVTYYGKVNGFPFSVVSVTTFGLISIWITMAIKVKRFNIIIIGAFVLSILAYVLVYTGVMFIPGMSTANISTFGWKIVLVQPNFYLITLLAVSIAAFPQVLDKCIRRLKEPTNWQILQEVNYKEKKSVKKPKALEMEEIVLIERSSPKLTKKFEKTKSLQM